MNQAVLLSIKPKWVGLIASGKKIVEIRKTRPKIDTPFKCYIYQTKAHIPARMAFGGVATDVSGVVGEFVCDYIYEDEHGEYADVFENSGCVPLAEQKEYAPNGILHGWHISELKMYDTPKQLKEFLKWNRECYWAELPMVRPKSCVDCGATGCHVYSAPQSWCFVEELE